MVVIRCQLTWTLVSENKFILSNLIFDYLFNNKKGYPEFGRHLNGTGRAMVYSCSWPVYQIYAGISPNFSSIIEHCNLWRNFDDIQDSWVRIIFFLIFVTKLIFVFIFRRHSRALLTTMATIKTTSFPTRAQVNKKRLNFLRLMVLLCLLFYYRTLERPRHADYRKFWSEL